MAKPILISDGLVSFAGPNLGFARGFVCCDPDVTHQYCQQLMHLEDDMNPKRNAWRIKISQDTTGSAGPLLSDARGERCARTTRDRRAWEYFRTITPRLSLERGRPRSDLRPPSMHLLRLALWNDNDPS